MIALLARQRSIRTVLEQARPRLYRLAWAWCRDADEANDLVQEACLRAMEKSRQLKDPARAEQWLTRIMSNLFLDRARSRREHVDIADVEVPCSEDGPLESAERCHAVERVRAAVAGLAVDQRMVVTLVDLMGYSYAEVGEVLDIPVGTVMSRLCRARRRLRDQLLLAAGPARQGGHLRAVK